MVLWCCLFSCRTHVFSQIKSSMLSTCSWCVLATSTIMLHHGPAHSESHPFSNNCLICTIIILDLYGPYDTLLNHAGFDFTVFIANEYQMIVRCNPYLRKQSQNSLIILIYFFCSLVNCRLYSQIFYKIFLM